MVTVIACTWLVRPVMGVMFTPNSLSAISTASASLMTEAVKGKKVAEALELSRKFQAMVVEGAPPDPTLGDLLALQGVAKLPARVKCATLAWHALEEALR